MDQIRKNDIGIIIVIILIILAAANCHKSGNDTATTAAPPIAQTQGQTEFIYIPSENLDDLCKDYFCWRETLLKYVKEGDSNSAVKVRKIFQQINGLINKYPEQKVSEAMDRAETNFNKSKRDYHP